MAAENLKIMSTAYSFCVYESVKIIDFDLWCSVDPSSYNEYWGTLCFFVLSYIFHVAYDIKDLIKERILRNKGLF